MAKLELKIDGEFAEKAMKRGAKLALNELLHRHDKGREKISSQCNTLISKRLVEDMIK